MRIVNFRFVCRTEDPREMSSLATDWKTFAIDEDGQEHEVDLIEAVAIEATAGGKLTAVMHIIGPQLEIQVKAGDTKVMTRITPTSVDDIESARNAPWCALSTGGDPVVAMTPAFRDALVEVGEMVPGAAEYMGRRLIVWTTT